MGAPRLLPVWIIGGVVVAVIGFFAAGTFVSKTEPASQTLQTLAPFSFPTSRGDIFSSEQLAGRIALVNFWATWCVPCRKEIPLLMAAQALNQRSLAVVGIAVDESEPVRRFEDEVGLDYTSLVGKTEALALMERYGNPGHLPFTLVFDRQGRLRYTKTGEIQSKDLDRWLADLL
jgi:thiol-disulfide isomerase/thioredoxin